MSHASTPCAWPARASSRAPFRWRSVSRRPLSAGGGPATRTVRSAALICAGHLSRPLDPKLPRVRPPHMARRLSRGAKPRQWVALGERKAGEGEAPRPQPTPTEACPVPERGLREREAARDIAGVPRRHDDARGLRQAAEGPPEGDEIGCDELSRRIKQLGGSQRRFRYRDPRGSARWPRAFPRRSGRRRPLHKAPLQTIRGAGEQEKMLHNARIEYEDEAHEIATTLVIESLGLRSGTRRPRSSRAASCATRSACRSSSPTCCRSSRSTSRTTRSDLGDRGARREASRK